MDVAAVISLHRDSVEKLVAENPDLGGALYRAIARSLIRRVDQYAGRIAHYRAEKLSHE